ncbi:ABC transporter-like protein [Phytophthora sojae]|uniref:ABC transporter-like protein n=1 Tax=Phytophthora sojae (strain P6497) TaxID=1094619 RepID=G5A8D0_PHYSP|nr:ABC transporter-like protein [Phytophthora sojae]EGZ08156.1 ABC transporter-like protein [Phytophthora sojae]|eukprot:XP_009536328.1 ABC transporter-like protein [Phytophthora sojae]
MKTTSLLVAVALLPLAWGASSSSSSVDCDADYEQLNASTGECECLEGFSGLGCRMCDDSAESDVCSANLGSGYSCVTGLSYDSTSLGKTYTCTLSSALQALFPGGALDVSCERDADGEANCAAAVYKAKDTVNGVHVINCNMTQCSFATGSTDGECGNIDCRCGPECSTVTKTLVEGSLSGVPAKIQVKAATQEMSIVIEGSPLPLSATCNASACERTGGSADASSGSTVLAATGSGDDSSDTGGVGLAIVTCAVLAAMLLFSFCACCCCPFGARRGQKDDLEMELLKANARTANTLEFRNLNCFAVADKTSGEQKCILNRISGTAERGQVLGLLGPSGSGKTTLLNALAAVKNGDAKFAGELLLDGKKLAKGYRRTAAYVQQDDSLYSTLTVRECITYSAQLRLPASMSDSAKSAMVDRVIAELNLGHIAGSRIGAVGGSSTERGVSGGERRRVSIGMELVTSPQILILDEPTSGLDSSSAHSVVQLVKELASHDRIVILSIHQPSARSFLLLDKIMLLGKGELLYSGAPADSKPYFQNLGHKCPDNENIADFILDIATDASNIPDSKPRGVLSSLLVETRVLFGRTAQNILRHRSLLVQHVVLSLVLALFGGLIFNNVTDDLAGFQNRTGAFYFILTFFGFASMSSMDLFIGERPIFLRETGAMYYGSFSYFMAKATLDALLLRVLPATLFACIFYWIMGLQATAECFLLFLLTLVLFNVAAGSICLLVGVLSKRVGSANLCATVVLLIMLLFGGFLLNSQTMPSSVGWIKHLSIFNYAFEILMCNELEGLILSFDAPGYPAVPVYGEVYLKTLGMDYTNRYYDIAALALIAIVLQLVAYIFLSMQVPAHHTMAAYEKDGAVAGQPRKEEGYEACSSRRTRP